MKRRGGRRMNERCVMRKKESWEISMKERFGISNSMKRRCGITG